MSSRPTLRIWGLTALALTVAMTATAQTTTVARYEFNNESLASTDTDANSVASPIAPQRPVAFWQQSGTGKYAICFTQAWRETTEQSPVNNSTNYLEITLTPNAGQPLSLHSLRIESHEHDNANQVQPVNQMALYADEDPSGAGNNFSTKLGQANIYAQTNVNDAWYTLDLSTVAFLQNRTTPVRLRLYFWHSGNPGSGSGEAFEIQVKAWQCGTLGDYVWLDLDRDGVQDGNEVGVGEVAVQAMDSTGTNVVASTTTSSTGFYSFCLSPALQYKVRWIAPSGYAFTLPDVGSGTTDSDANPSTGVSTGNPITLTAGGSVLTYDAGLVINQAKIGNRVWADADCDGLQDGNETGLSGVQVALYDLASPTPGTPVATTTTDGDGLYEFCVDSGTYRVGFVTPSGYVVTDPLVGGDTDIDSDAPLGDLISGPISVVAGTVRHDLDAGFCVCLGVQAVAVPLGPSCFQLLDPVLSGTQPVLGTQTTISVDSVFPNALVLPFFSLAPVTPIQVGNTGCFVYVDAFNPGNLFMPGTGYTDANGHWEITFVLPNDPMLANLSFIFQVRLCAPNGPAGPLAPDWATNGLFLRLGCP